MWTHVGEKSNRLRRKFLWDLKPGALCLPSERRDVIWLKILLDKLNIRHVYIYLDLHNSWEALHRLRGVKRGHGRQGFAEYISHWTWDKVHLRTLQQAEWWCCNKVQSTWAHKQGAAERLWAVPEGHSRERIIKLLWGGLYQKIWLLLMGCCQITGWAVAFYDQRQWIPSINVSNDTGKRMVWRKIGTQDGLWVWDSALARLFIVPWTMLDS